MESVTSSLFPHKMSNYDEFSMQQSIQFSDSLKDLRSLKKQLYSAAEYFESSYRKHEEKQVVMTTVKEYTLKAFINTVDHLGSMSYKVDCLLNDKSQELSTIELPFSCIEQRLRTCRQFVNHGGLSRESLMVEIPKYHTRYILSEEMNSSSRVSSKFAKIKADTEIGRNDPQPTSGGAATITMKKEQIQQSVVDLGTFSFTKASPNRRPERRETSPYRFNLARSGSVIRSTSPNPANSKKRSPSEPRRSVSPSTQAVTNRRSEVELYVSKNKRMFKALLGMRKQKQDGKFYKYLDEQ